MIGPSLSAQRQGEDVFWLIYNYQFSHALSEDKGHTKDWEYRWEGCMSAGPVGCNNAESISYFAMGKHITSSISALR